MVLGIAACAGMFLVRTGDLDLASWLFILIMVGVAGSYVVLRGPAAAHRPPRRDRPGLDRRLRDRLRGRRVSCSRSTWPGSRCRGSSACRPGRGSTTGEATLPARLAFLSVAVWWAVFSIPLFRRVPEPPPRLEPDERPGESPVRAAFVRLGETFRELRSYRQAFLMLLAFLIYNDGIQTIIKMATAYGTEIGIGQSALIGAILLVQFVGIPCTFLFGSVAGRIGAKRSLFLGLLAYTVISILGYYMTTATHFYILAGLVGMVQGGTQALSRWLFASMIPQHKSGEFFGFFSIFEKFAGIFGPLIFAGTIARDRLEPERDPVRDRLLRGGSGAARPGERGGGPAGGAGGGAGAGGGGLLVHGWGLAATALHLDRHSHCLAGHDGVGLRIPTHHLAEIRDILQRDQVHAGIQPVIRLLGVHADPAERRSGDGELVPVTVGFRAGAGHHDAKTAGDRADRRGR